MISENYIITLCLLIFFSPYLIIICSSICLFKDMWENGKGYRGQSKNCILLPGFPELTVQLFVFDEITMKIDLFRANAGLISSSHSSLSRPHVKLPLPPLEMLRHSRTTSSGVTGERWKPFFLTCMPTGTNGFPVSLGWCQFLPTRFLRGVSANKACCCPPSCLKYVGSSQWNTHLSAPNPPALLKCPFFSVMLPPSPQAYFAMLCSMDTIHLIL